MQHTIITSATADTFAEAVGHATEQATGSQLDGHLAQVAARRSWNHVLARRTPLGTPREVGIYAGELWMAASGELLAQGYGPFDGPAGQPLAHDTETGDFTALVQNVRLVETFSWSGGSTTGLTDLFPGFSSLSEEDWHALAKRLSPPCQEWSVAGKRARA